MPRIRYVVTMSLDGYIAGPQGEVDWIVSEPAADFGELFAQFDTFLVGRRTFELMSKPGSPPLPSGSKTFVFSRTLQNNHPGVSVLADVSPSVIARIKAEAKKDTKKAKSTKAKSSKKSGSSKAGSAPSEAKKDTK